MFDQTQAYGSNFFSNSTHIKTNQKQQMNDSLKYKLSSPVLQPLGILHLLALVSVARKYISI